MKQDDGFSNWTRRQFAKRTAMAGIGYAVSPIWANAVNPLAPDQVQPTLPPPEVTSGSIRPLFIGQTSRPLRYQPVDGSFVIHNGKESFNRPLYSTSAFRIDAGDIPEFSLYLPGHGGNLKFGFLRNGSSKWAANAGNVLARYREGRMTYEIRDPLLGEGTLIAEVLTGIDHPSLLLCVHGENLPTGVSLAWAYAGASGRKGKRGGDIGCESEPVAQFFQVRPEECEGNRFTLETSPHSIDAHLQSHAGNFLLQFPESTSLHIEEFSSWTEPPSISTGRQETQPQKQPILTGSCPLQNEPLYVAIHVLSEGETSVDQRPLELFEKARVLAASNSQRIAFSTPDVYIDAAAPALSSAFDGLWDAKQGCVMHGAVAWRSPLAGWRGPYILDVLGEHEKARIHFRHWLSRQNTSPITTSDPATGPYDPDKRMARKESLLHSNGDLSHNHYDMNLVFFDVLLRHLRWTGDMDFAQEIWPAYMRHLAWEQRLFRRTFAGRDNKQLPLYEAYAAIWASDNLQYNGGGTAHASAYNAFSFHRAAELAQALNKDPAPFATEAQAIDTALQELLWLPTRGVLAESKDLMQPQTTYDNAALWTLYHAIDSETVDRQQAWQMIAERLHTLKRIPIHGEGIPAGDWYLLSCSDWLPYMWSLNLILMAENSHMALAMWQTGMRDEAFRLLKGNLLDSMYQGLCPGDFHMTSQLDAHRQEAQRDFGDPTGITARSLVEGLFGIRPDLLQGRLTWMPGFPSDWNRASMTHRDFQAAWKRDGMIEKYSLECRFAKPVAVQFVVPARSTELPTVLSSGKQVSCSFAEDAVGLPLLAFSLPQAEATNISITWRGTPPIEPPSHQEYFIDENLNLPHGVSEQSLHDPQKCLDGRKLISTGAHTVFARMREGNCQWLMPISFTVKAKPIPALTSSRKNGAYDEVDLTSVLQHQLKTIFTRGYQEPRSPFCSLALPDTLLGGWANIGEPIPIDDKGLRNAQGKLLSDTGVPFRTPSNTAPNCRFLSWFAPDNPELSIPVSGRAHGLYLLITGTTVPQCSRMVHATMTAHYMDGTSSTLPLKNPETWWPIEQDYLLDDYQFSFDGPLPSRIDLATGRTRSLDPATFKGKGRSIPGGAATIVHLELDPAKELKSIDFKMELYGIVMALLGITLQRS